MCQITYIVFISVGECFTSTSQLYDDITDKEATSSQDKHNVTSAKTFTHELIKQF